MLYMTIVTWEPDKTEELIKRYQQVGTKFPKGMKVISQWSELHGGRIFQLSEVPAPDPKITIEACSPWYDLCKIECIPVMETEELMKLIPRR